MSATDFSLTQAILKELIHYDPTTGIFTWLERDLKWFKHLRSCNRWNAVYAETKAGTISKRGYVSIFVLGKQYKAHRLAWLYMTGEWPIEIDHQDGDGLNNKWNNLRNVDHCENMKNIKKRKNNTSGVTGIRWSHPHKKWRADLMVDKKRVHIGLFDEIKNAEIAIKTARKKYNFHENHGRIMSCF